MCAAPTALNFSDEVFEVQGRQVVCVTTSKKMQSAISGVEVGNSKRNEAQTRVDGGRSLRGGKMNMLRAKVKGKGSARRPPRKESFFRKAKVTAEAVTYKGKSRNRRRAEGVASQTRKAISNLKLEI